MAVADFPRLQELVDGGTIKSALVILPVNPSIDQTAAALTLASALEKKSDISVTVACPTPVLVEANRLVGVQKVRQDLGDKNLVISFADYPADDIERVAYNIENGQFTLSVIPKPGKIGPKEDQIIHSYSGTSADLVLAVGVNYPEDLGKFSEIQEILQQPNLALVGNTPLSGWPRAIELIDASGPSVSEVVMEIIEKLGVEIDSDTATNLFLGLENGTRNFTSASVSAQTFARASELLQKGAHRAPATSQGQVPQMPTQALPSDYSPVARDGSNLG